MPYDEVAELRRENDLLKLKLSNTEAKLAKAQDEITWTGIARKIEDEALKAGFHSTAIPDVLSRAKRVDGEWKPHAEHGAMVRKFDTDMLDDHANKLTMRTWVKNLTADPEAANWLVDKTAGASPVNAAFPGASMRNPYLKGHENFTEQGRLEASNPALAARLAAETDAAAGRSSAGTKNRNPFLKEHENLTEQGRLVIENPALAKQMAAAAGVKLSI
jgi:hypothetical protein